MNLPNLALIGVVIVGVIYAIGMLIGLIAAWPFGLIGLVVIGFVGVLFFGVLNDRLKNEEDDYYEKNVKD